MAALIVLNHGEKNLWTMKIQIYIINSYSRMSKANTLVEEYWKNFLGLSYI